MTRDEAQAAVLRFLDQFIERGAAPDVVALRDRLAGHPEARRLFDTFAPNDQPTEREAFDAMRALLAAEWERSGRNEYASPPGLMILISWTEPWIGSAEEVAHLTTSDPAQWHDWLASVQSVRPG